MESSRGHSVRRLSLYNGMFRCGVHIIGMDQGAYRFENGTNMIYFHMKQERVSYRNRNFQNQTLPGMESWFQSVKTRFWHFSKTWVWSKKGRIEKPRFLSKRKMRFTILVWPKPRLRSNWMIESHGEGNPGFAQVGRTSTQYFSELDSFKFENQ